MSENLLAYHDRFLEPAESAARKLIHSWVLHGPRKANEFGPDRMPTGIFAEVGSGVLDAMLTHGAKDLAGVMAYFNDAPQAIRDELMECTMDFAPLPSNCGPLIETLCRYDHARKLEHLASRLKNVLEAAEDPAAVLAEIAALQAEAANGTGRASLRERAYALRFNPDVAPPDETCMAIGEYPIAALGNLTAIQGKSKVGKSAIVSAILGAAQRGVFQAAGDTLCMSWTRDSSGAIIHLDSEQSQADWHGLICRSVTRSGLAAVSPRLVSLPLVMFSRADRMEILRQTMAHEREEKGGIDTVVIDGVADLCQSPNDEAEALEVVSQLMAMAQTYRAAAFCVLHENPTSDQGKTRGHLGSELNRKAFANLRIDKDSETLISTIYGLDMRKRDIPKEQGFCFAWDDQLKMHAFQGRAAGLKAAQRESEAIAKARAEWEAIYDFAASIGTNGTCPDLSANLAAQAERDKNGTKKLTNLDTMKKRMQRAESLGVLRKSGAGFWVLNHNGTSGT